MASAQLKAGNSNNVSTTVVLLSNKTKVTAHPGEKWKAGYLTISRVNLSKCGWRNVHISKRAFEKFAEHSELITRSLKDKQQYQVMLNKKQHVMTTRFERGEQPSLYYVSILHPITEKESLKAGDEVNHAKTINLSVEEYAKFESELKDLLAVVRSKSTNDNDETAAIKGFRWIYKDTKNRSPKVFPTREQCSKDAERHFLQMKSEEYPDQPMEYEYESHYEFQEVEAQRCTKLEVIEHLMRCFLWSALIGMEIDMSGGPPTLTQVEECIEKFDKPLFANIVKKILLQLRYKNAYLASELVDLFLYLKGMDKVRDAIVAHKTMSSSLFTRLLDHCYDDVCDQMETL